MAKSRKEYITVIGDGGWGTTLAVHLCHKGFPVTLWGPFSAHLDLIRQEGVNTKFLPGIKLPASLKFEADLKTALSDCDLVIFAIPSKFAEDVIVKISKLKIDWRKKGILSVTKGIDERNLKRISEIILKYIPKVPLAVLSGPTIALEVAQAIPSTAVIASKNIALAKRLQAIINTDHFRIYTNSDITGVEIGGSIKNVIAIACGVCDGLGYGTNTKAAILTRGLAEIARLGEAMGAKAKTFVGLSGLGDLVTTCFSPRSRNRTVGEALGSGQTINAILGQMEMVAEGVETVKAIHKLSLKHKVSMPICSEVYKIIYQRKKPSLAVSGLMGRKLKSE